MLGSNPRQSSLRHSLSDYTTTRLDLDHNSVRSHPQSASSHPQLGSISSTELDPFHIQNFVQISCSDRSDSLFVETNIGFCNDTWSARKWFFVTSISRSYIVTRFGFPPFWAKGSGSFQPRLSPQCTRKWFRTGKGWGRGWDCPALSHCTRVLWPYSLSESRKTISSITCKYRYYKKQKKLFYHVLWPYSLSLKEEKQFLQWLVRNGTTKNKESFFITHFGHTVIPLKGGKTITSIVCE